MARAISGARLRLSTLKLMTESRSGSSKRRCASARRRKPICGIVLIEAGVKGAGEAEAHVFGNHAQRRHLALRADDHARNRRWRRRWSRPDRCPERWAEARALCAGADSGLRLERLHRAGRGRGEQVADRPLIVGQDAFDQRAAIARAAGHQHLLVQAGRGGDDVRHLAQTRQQRPPIGDAAPIHLHQLHVRAGAEQLVLQVAPHAVGDGESDDERGHARGDAGDGDGRDDADHGLPPLGFQVPRRDIKLESHGSPVESPRHGHPSGPKPR